MTGKNIFLFRAAYVAASCFAFVFLVLSSTPAGAASISADYPPSAYGCTGAEELLARQPKKLDLLIDMAVCVAQKGHPNYARVEKKIDAAVKAHPKDARLSVLAAMVYEKHALSEMALNATANKNFARAEKLFEAASRLAPHEGYIWFERAELMRMRAERLPDTDGAFAKKAVEYSLAAIAKAPLDAENWKSWQVNALRRTGGLAPEAKHAMVLQLAHELEKTVETVLAAPVPAPKGFIFDREFVRKQNRRVANESTAFTAPEERRRGMVCGYVGFLYEWLGEKMDQGPFRRELAIKAYDWHARSVREDPADLRAWGRLGRNKVNDYPYDEGREKIVYPAIVAAARAKLNNPAWPGASLLTSEHRNAGLSEKDLRGMVIYETILVFTAGRQLSLEEKQEEFALFTDAVTHSPQNLRNVSNWFNCGVGLWWEKNLPEDRKKRLLGEMKALLDAALPANEQNLAKVATLAGMENDAEAVGKTLKDRWNEYYAKLEELRKK